MPGDDGAYELSPNLPEDTAACDAGDLVEHFADATPPEERVQARTGDARALDTVPGRAWRRVRPAMRLLGDLHLRNGGQDGEERRRGEAGILLSTAARLLDGILASVRRDEGVVHHVMFHRGVVTAGPGIPLDLSAATGRLPPRSGTGVNDPRNWGQGAF